MVPENEKPELDDLGDLGDLPQTPSPATAPTPNSPSPPPRRIPPPPGGPASGGIKPAAARPGGPKKQGMLTQLLRRKDLKPAGETKKVTVDGADAIKLLASRTIKFKVAEEIGRADDMVVMTGEDRSLRRQMAFKFFRSREKDLQTDFVVEAQIVGQLQHPNIAPVYEIGTDDSHRPYAAIRHLTGPTLLDEIELAFAQLTDPRTRYRRLLDPFLRVCDAIAYAHDRGVMHRALTPETIFVGRFGEVLVGEWSFAQLLGDDARQSARPVVATPQTADTIAYQPPEQLRIPDVPLDEAADIYALGAILYHALSGEAPFDGDTPDELREAAMNRQRFVSPAKRAPKANVPAELDAIAMRAMSADKPDRFASATEIRDAVAAFLWAPTASSATDPAEDTLSAASTKISTRPVSGSRGGIFDDDLGLNASGDLDTLDDSGRMPSSSATSTASADEEFDAVAEYGETAIIRRADALTSDRFGDTMAIVRDVLRPDPPREPESPTTTTEASEPGGHAAERPISPDDLNWRIVGQWAWDWSKKHPWPAIGSVAGGLFVVVFIAAILGVGGGVSGAELEALRDAKQKWDRHLEVDLPRRNTAAESFASAKQRMTASTIAFNPADPQPYFAALVPTVAQMAWAVQTHPEPPTQWRAELDTALKKLQADAMALENWALAESFAQQAFALGTVSPVDLETRRREIQAAAERAAQRDRERLRQALARIEAAETAADQSAIWPQRTDDEARLLARHVGVHGTREALGQLAGTTPTSERLTERGRVFLIQFLAHQADPTTDAAGHTTANLAAQKLSAPTASHTPTELAAWVMTAARVEAKARGSVADFDSRLTQLAATHADNPEISKAVAVANATLVESAQTRPMPPATAPAFSAHAEALGEWVAAEVVDSAAFERLVLQLATNTRTSPKQAAFVFEQIGRHRIASAVPMLRATLHALPMDWLGDTMPVGENLREWRRTRELAIASAMALARLGDAEFLRDLFHRRQLAGEESEFYARTQLAFAWMPVSAWGDPQSPDDALALATALIQRGDNRNAQRWLDVAIEQAPRSVPALSLRAAQKSRAGDFPAAVADWDAVLRIDPHHLDAHIHRGLLLQKMGRFEDAKASYDEALRRQPMVPMVWHNRATVRQSLGDWLGAKRDYDRAIELGLAEPTAFFNRGLARRALGDFAGAIADLTRALEGRPEMSEAWLNRGLARFDLGDWPAAIADFEKSLALADGSAAVALAYRGAARRQLGDTATAMQDLDRAVALDARLPVAFFHRAVTHEQLGDVASARADYDRTLALAPHFAPALLNRGLLAQAAGRYDLAMGDFNRAISSAPDFADAYVSRGALHSLEGRPRLAMADYDRALELAPTHWQAWANRGFELLRANRADEAKAAFERAVQYCPAEHRAALARFAAG